MRRLWRLAHGRVLELGVSGRIMGILNVTPDSFSGDGRYLDVEAAIGQAQAMLADGATIIDVGGESTRPGAEQVSAEEEQRRVLPVIAALAARSDAILSIDTYRVETARLAVEAGAHIVNDVWGLSREPAIAELAAETGAGLVIMHTGRDRKKLPDVIDDQRYFLGRALKIAAQAGVDPDQIMLDPGFGFAKEETDENVELMNRFAELMDLGFPWLVGTSRKRFVGAVSGREPADRDVATAATSAVLRLAGADVFRVHNVAINRDALAVADAMLAQRARMTSSGEEG
jgi:dihydropteroate synthase